MLRMQLTVIQLTSLLALCLCLSLLLLLTHSVKEILLLLKSLLLMQ